MPISPHNPTLGSRLALVTIVEFADLQDPFTAKVWPTLTTVREIYGPDNVRIVWKNDPLPFHANAAPAAEAALAAGAQGKFWPMHDKLFENNTALDRASLERYAQELGLDMTRFKADLDAERYKTRIEADKQEGAALGVEGTPAAFINGRKIAGAYPLETFQAIADAELAKAEAAANADGAGKGPTTKSKKAAAHKAR